jgi:hypothetical protein
MASNRLVLSAFAAAALAGLPAMAHADQPKVGVTAAVNPQTQGQPVQAPMMRTLYVGADVMFKERIVTSANGQAQLLFLDQSALTVAPNSELVIDEFVYDPEQKTGKIAATVAKGLFRFVGGRISKHQDVTFKTPTATVGIRGGVLMLKVAADGSTHATFLYGDHMTVTSGGQTRIVTRPGFTVQAVSNGAPPSSPVRASSTEISSSLGALEGHSDSTGGISSPPTDNSIPPVASGNVSNPTTVGTGNSTPTSQSGESASSGCTGTCTPTLPSSDQHGPDAATPTTLTLGPLSGRYKSTPGTGSTFGTTDYSTNRNRGFTGLAVQNGRVEADLGGDSFDVPAPATLGTSLAFDSSGTRSPFGPVSGTGYVSGSGDFLFYQMTEANYGDEHAFLFAGTPTSLQDMQSGGQRIDTYSVSKDGILDSTIPFIRNAGGGNVGGASVSNLYLARQSSGTLGVYGSGDFERTTGFQASLAISGQGADQTSAIAVMTGVVTADGNFTGDGFSSGKPLFAGGATATARTSATGQLVTSATSVTGETDSSGNAFFGDGQPKYFALDNATVNAATSHRTESPSGSEFTQDRTTVNSYAFNQVATQTGTPSSVGASRTAMTLNGYVGGLGQSTNSGDTPAILRNSTQTDPAQVTIKTFPSLNRLSAQFNVAVQDFDPGSTIGSAKFNFGGVGHSDDIAEFQGKTFLASRSAFVDDNLFAAREQRVNDGSANGADTTQVDGTTVTLAHSYMVSSAAVTVDKSVLPSGVSFCECQYLKWGYWGADLTNPNTAGEYDAGHLMTWVAGTLADVTDLQGLTGSATYSGHAIGNVYNGSAQYVAVGKFTNTWNFGTRTGTVDITKFDGRNFTGLAVSSTNARDYSGSATLTAASHNFAVTVNGSFFKGGTDPAAETGGQFSIVNSGGSTYRAAGTFAAKK